MVSAGGSQSLIRSGSWADDLRQQAFTTAPRDWNPADFNGNNFPDVSRWCLCHGWRPASLCPLHFAYADQLPVSGWSRRGLIPVTVTNSLGTSNSVMATAGTYAPAFFIGTATASRNYVAATESQNGGTVYIGPANTPGVRPAKAGENLTLWGTGFGPTTPTVPAGSLFSGAAPLNDIVTIMIDGVVVSLAVCRTQRRGIVPIQYVVPNLPTRGPQADGHDRRSVDGQTASGCRRNRRAMPCKRTFALVTGRVRVARYGSGQAEAGFKLMLRGQITGSSFSRSSQRQLHSNSCVFRRGTNIFILSCCFCTSVRSRAHTWPHETLSGWSAL